MPVLAYNKRASFDYQILSTYSAGLSLDSYLVKEIRAKKVILNGKFVVFQKKQLQIINLGSDNNQVNVPLLLNKREQDKIISLIAEKGITIIVNKIFTVKRWLKAEIAIVKGKKNFDKRQSIKEKDISREMARESSLK